MCAGLVPLFHRNLLPFALWDSNNLHEETLMVPLVTLKSTSERQRRRLMILLNRKMRKHSSVPVLTMLLRIVSFQGSLFSLVKWMENSVTCA